MLFEAHTCLAAKSCHASENAVFRRTIYFACLFAGSRVRISFPYPASSHRRPRSACALRLCNQRNNATHNTYMHTHCRRLEFSSAVVPGVEVRHTHVRLGFDPGWVAWGPKALLWACLGCSLSPGVADRMGEPDCQLRRAIRF